MRWLNAWWTYATIAGILALHTCPARVWGAASRLTAKFRTRRRACPKERVSLTRQWPPRQRAAMPPATRHAIPAPSISGISNGGNFRPSDTLRRIHAVSRRHRQVQKFRVPTPLAVRKATWTGASTRVPGQPGAVGDTGMCGRSLFGNREISRLACGRTRWPASGRRGAVADDARS